MTDTDIKSKSSLRNATLIYTFNTLYTSKSIYGTYNSLYKS